MQYEKRVKRKRRRNKTLSRSTALSGAAKRQQNGDKRNICTPTDVVGENSMQTTKYQVILLSQRPAYTHAYTFVSLYSMNLNALSSIPLFCHIPPVLCIIKIISVLYVFYVTHFTSIALFHFCDIVFCFVVFGTDEMRHTVRRAHSGDHETHNE